MKLTDAERAENREALAHMSLVQRLDHIFEYYKFPLVLALIAAVALGSVTYYRLTRRQALLYVGCANVAASPATCMPMQKPVTAFTCIVLFVSPSITTSPSATLNPAYC